MLSVPVAPLAVMAAELVAACVLAALHRHYASIVAIAALLGSVDAWVQSAPQLPESLEGRKLAYTATIDEVREGDSGSMLVCTLDSVAGQALQSHPKVQVYSVSSEFPFEQRRTLRFIATMRPVTSHTDVPDETDYARYLRGRGIAAVAILRPDDVIAIGDESPGFFYSARQAMLQLLYEVPLNNRTHEFLAATLAGDDSVLTAEVRADLSQAGVAHILALSGLHVGIIAIVIAVMLYPLTLMGMHRTRIAATIIALWLFAAVTGMSTSVVRAVIMASIVLGGRLLQRESSPLNSLCAAALIILLVTPADIYSIGFQLSFAAVGSILLLAAPLNPVHPRYRVLYAVTAYIAATIAAMMSAGVLSVFYFHTFPVYFLLGNIISALLLPPMIGLGILCMLIESVATVPTVLCTITDFLYSCIAGTAGFICHLPGAVIDNIYITPATMVCIVAAVAFAITAVRLRRLSWVAATAIAAMGAWMVASLTAPHTSQHEHFITRNSYHTSLLIRDGDSLYIVTTAPVERQVMIVHDAAVRYRDYYGRRGLGAPSLAPDSIDGAYFSRRGNIIDLGGKRYLLVAGNHALPDSNAAVVTMIVARGFTGDIVALYRRVRPDSLIISADVNARRARRYERECREVGIPVRLMRLHD